MTNQKVSVITPAYNSARTIGEVLNALFRQTHKNIEVIVIDDGSADDTARIASNFPCKLIKLKKNSGIARARNAGLKEATGDFIYFLDSDCIPNEDCLALLLMEIESESDIGIVGGSGVDKYMDKNWVALAYYVSEWYDCSPGLKKEYRNFLRTANLLVKSEVIAKVGGFNEDIFAGEDFDFCVRARNQGYKLVYLPEAIIVHDHPRVNLKSYLQTFYRNGLGGTIFRLMYKPTVPYSKFFPERAVLFALVSPAFILYAIPRIIIKNLRFHSIFSFFHILPIVLLGQIFWAAGGVAGVKIYRKLYK